MRTRQTLIVLLLAGALPLTESACGYLGTAKAKSNKKDAAVSAKIIQVEDRAIRRSVEAVGTLFPDDQVVVSSQVEGPVQKFLVDVGDAVQQGQVLAVIDQEELRYTIERRTGDLQKTLARLGLADENGQVKDIAELPDVKKAAANLFDAEQRYKRLRDMFQQALVAQQDLDTAQARYNSAKADYDVTVQTMKTLQAELRSEKSDLDLARKKLRDCEIRAPFAGLIQERHISPGQYLKVQAPVMTLVKPDPLRLRADVPERLASWIEVGETVEATSEALSTRRFSGTIRRITPAVKDQSRTFTIEALIANHELLLKPGFFVKVIVATHKTDNVLLLPETALLYSYGVYKAYLVENGRLIAREVKLGDAFGNRVEIVSGLKAGDRVALNPEQLREGAPVSGEGPAISEKAKPGEGKKSSE